MRVVLCPSHRFPFGFEKSVDDERVSFARISPGQARCFSAEHGRPAVDSDTAGVVEHHSAAEWNFSWIDSAMSFTQAGASRSGAFARALAAPINSHARE
jgi:hypothetical protein